MEPINCRMLSLNGRRGVGAAVIGIWEVGVVNALFRLIRHGLGRPFLVVVLWI